MGSNPTAVIFSCTTPNQRLIMECLEHCKSLSRPLGPSLKCSLVPRPTTQRSCCFLRLAILQFLLEMNNSGWVSVELRSGFGWVSVGFRSSFGRVWVRFRSGFGGCSPLKPMFNHLSSDSSLSGPVAQWIRHRPTEPGIAGSSPAGVILLFHIVNSDMRGRSETCERWV